MMNVFVVTILSEDIIMKTLMTIALLFVSIAVNAQGFNQQYTINQNQNMNMQYGSTNWYSSALGMGVAQAGVTLVGGLVNMMNRPETPVVQQQQPIYVNQQPQQSYQGACQQQIVYDQQGNQREVRVCQ